jgi:hypothetical protein
MDESMILTEAEYRCLIGIPPRKPNQQIIFICIKNLTNSKGNAGHSLSSYGLSINKQGEIRGDCAPDPPCLEFNALLAGPLEEIAFQCGWLEKLVRMETQTPFRQLLGDALLCQKSSEPACIVETICAEKER